MAVEQVRFSAQRGKEEMGFNQFCCWEQGSWLCKVVFHAAAVEINYS
jgi:hypothetical protein